VTFWELLLIQWQQQSIGEVFAVLLAVCYVWLATQESVWCWPAGFVSTALFAYVFWDVTLIFQMLLNIYYMAMAVWGFISWRKQGTNKVSISRMAWQEHINIVSLGFVGTGLVYLIARQWLNYDLVLLDITISIFSLLATYLTVVKKLENWCYWSLINISSILLLLDKQLYLTIVLMLIYLLLAIRGLIYWYKVYSRENLHGF
jgi:nicotinamide mononucleotide transporter